MADEALYFSAKISDEMNVQWSKSKSWQPAIKCKEL
jgi:hypothetical protein